MGLRISYQPAGGSELLGTFLKELVPLQCGVSMKIQFFGQSGLKRFEKLCESMGIKVLMK